MSGMCIHIDKEEKMFFPAIMEKYPEIDLSHLFADHDHLEVTEKLISNHFASALKTG